MSIPPFSEPLSEPLSDAELDELEQFLMSGATSDETLLIDSLDGYLTAIVIAPTTVMPSRWLPGVWGPTPEQAPQYESPEQAQRILGLVLRHMNGIVYNFQDEPDSFEPMFCSREYRGRRYLDGEGWAMGFMQAVHLMRPEWQHLFEHPEMIDALRPIHLLGSEDVTDEEDALTTTRAKRERLTKKIPQSLAAIHRFWLPYRHAATERTVATTMRREHPKVGRNDPCPCGSGKKFKKCCGQASVLH